MLIYQGAIMSISLDMYKILKKSELRPIIFVDMDHTILVRYKDFSNFQKHVEDCKKRVLSDKEYDNSKDISFLESYSHSYSEVLSAEGLKFMVRDSICDLISSLSDIGDVYILTASNDNNARKYFSAMLDSGNYPCLSKVIRVISSLKSAFSKEDLESLPNDYIARPYVLIDDNDFRASSQKHNLMGSKDFREYENFHVKVPRFTESIKLDTANVVSEVRQKLKRQSNNYGV